MVELSVGRAGTARCYGWHVNALVEDIDGEERLHSAGAQASIACVRSSVPVVPRTVVARIPASLNTLAM